MKNLTVLEEDGDFSFKRIHLHFDDLEVLQIQIAQDGNDAYIDLDRHEVKMLINAIIKISN